MSRKFWKWKILQQNYKLFGNYLLSIILFTYMSIQVVLLCKCSLKIQSKPIFYMFTDGFLRTRSNVRVNFCDWSKSCHLRTIFLLMQHVGTTGENNKPMWWSTPISDVVRKLLVVILHLLGQYIARKLRKEWICEINFVAIKYVFFYRGICCIYNSWTLRCKTNDLDIFILALPTELLVQCNR